MLHLYREQLSPETTDLSLTFLTHFLSERNQPENWRNSFQVGWNYFTKEVENIVQLPFEDQSCQSVWCWQFTVESLPDNGPQAKNCIIQDDTPSPGAAHDQWLVDAGYKGKTYCLNLGQLWREIPVPELPKGSTESSVMSVSELNSSICPVLLLSLPNNWCF